MNRQVFQSRYTDGQQIHANMFNNTNYQIKTTSHLLVWHYQEDKRKIIKGAHLYTVGGNVNWFKYCGEQYGDFSKSEK